MKRKMSRGQSLVEFALSVPFLILIFCGVVDLGRAYFSWVQLQSAITEGTHWAATYPSCIANAGNYAGGTHAECKQSNAIDERILNEDAQLNRNDYLCITANITPSTDTANPVPGDDVELHTKFRVRLVTPLMSAALGPWLYIYGDSHETIRGKQSDLPAIAPINMADQGGITPSCAIP